MGQFKMDICEDITETVHNAIYNILTQNSRKNFIFNKLNFNKIHFLIQVKILASYRILNYTFIG